MSSRLSGCGTALVTPLSSSGELDEVALRALVEWQVSEGIHMVIPCGSTGEAVTLSPPEQRRVVELVVAQVAGRVPVIAGAGSNDTRKAIETSLAMKAAGATHLLHVTPMYNKPPQRGMVAHFRAIADACDLPIVIYNVPGRTAINLDAESCLELAEDSRFVGIKEASGSLAQIREIIRHRPEHFAVLSGDDALTLSVMAHGGDGVISVVSNVVPRLMAQWCRSLAAGDLAAARVLDAQIAPVIHAAFVESNPIPIKAMLAMLGRMTDTVRLPLVPLLDPHRQTMLDALVHAGALVR